MECNFGNTIACLLQFWNWLENRGSKVNKMFREVWKAVETKAGKTRVAKTKRKEKEVEKKEKTKKRENNEIKKSSRRIGDLG